jgi:micrococcal nuclease
MRRVAPAVALLILAVVALAALARGGDELPASAVVRRVVDGDTLLISAGGRSERVRLLGIDTPETVAPDRPVECFGPQSSAYAKRLLDGRRVALRYDRETRDRYGRLLAYVYLGGEDGVFVNARLVEQGYARTLSFAPNTAHAAALAALERRAAVAGRGLWAACG